MSGDPKRVLRGGGALSGEVARARGSRRRRRRSEALTGKWNPPPVTKTEGTLPRGFGVSRLTDLPASWASQRRALGIAARD